MSKQVLISLGREFGSGGHKIAQKIAERLDITYYDKNILDHMFGEDTELAAKMKKYDEKHANPLLTRRVKGYSNSIEDILVEQQFEFIREKADAGESFIIVGRCGETVLRDYRNHISIFVLGDLYDKVCHIQEWSNLNEKEALDEILRVDRIRKRYHNRHSDIKWGDSRGYDICVNDTRLGIDGTTELLLAFIEKRREMM